MDGAHHFVGGRRDDGARSDHFTFRRFPRIVQTRKAERFVRFEPDEHGRFLCSLGAPFVKAIGDNETTPLLKRMFEAGFLRDRFGARVDHTRSDLGILRWAFEQYFPDHYLPVGYIPPRTTGEADIWGQDAMQHPMRSLGDGGIYVFERTPQHSPD